jgi:16S rRNA (guanine(966)-N(2))-methyltransferase RsmD
MSQLRVISGVARGRKLYSVPGDKTRPITDKVKESLFSILYQDISGSEFLDLFAGTGSVGIEALSRGANYARFIDLQFRAIETIKANLQLTKLADNAEVLMADSFHHLVKDADRKFDYVYVAPPQYKEMWSQALLILDQHTQWLKEDAWVIVQIHPKEYKELALVNLSLFDQRKYGNTLLLFYENSPNKVKASAN